MSDVNSVQQIVAALRSQIATRMDGSNPQVRKAAKNRNKTKNSGAQDPGQRLHQLIVQRVNALDPDDPKRGRKAFRIFLESILIAEFGEALINDAAFNQMVDDIQCAMEEHADTAKSIESAMSSLLGTNNRDR